MVSQPPQMQVFYNQFTESFKIHPKIDRPVNSSQTTFGPTHPSKVEQRLKEESQPYREAQLETIVNAIRTRGDPSRFTTTFTLQGNI